MRLIILVVIVVVTAIALIATQAIRREPRDERPDYLRIVPAADLADDLKPLVARLGSADPMDRASAASSLRDLGQRAAPATSYLVRLLPDRTRLRIAVGEGGRFSCPGALAAEALGNCGDTGAAALSASITGGDDAVRRSAVEGAAYCTDARVVSRLIDALADEDGLIQESAQTALVRIGSPAVDSLLNAAKNRDDPVRSAAMLTLSRIKDPRVTSALHFSGKQD